MNAASYLFILVVVLVIDAAVGAIIGNYRGHAGVGLGLGLLLGPIGWLIVAVLPSSTAEEARRLREVQAHLGGGSLVQSPTSTPVSGPGASAAAPVAPANWYTDPWNPDRLRWWDGMQWTGQTAGDAEQPGRA